MFHRVCKTDDARQIVWGEVYAPNVVDTHGEMMLPEDVETICHRFMQVQSLKQAIDTQHNNESNGCYPIESFIARNNPDYTEGAWVMAVKIDDATIWDQIKKGELNGFSFEAYVSKQQAVVELEVYPQSVGQTEEADGHSHFFFAELDADGKVIGGRTSEAAGHVHEVKRGTATEICAGHAHRIFV